MVESLRGKNKTITKKTTLAVAFWLELFALCFVMFMLGFIVGGLL